MRSSAPPPSNGARYTIAIESAVGKGTRVIVTLPVSQLPAPPVPQKTDARSPPLRRGRILVVDDERALCTTYERLLGVEHSVVTTQQGEVALTLIAAGERFDAILCDLMMPSMSGMELHRRRVHP